MSARRRTGAVRLLSALVLATLLPTAPATATDGLPGRAPADSDGAGDGARVATGDGPVPGPDAPSEAPAADSSAGGAGGPGTDGAAAEANGDTAAEGQVPTEAGHAPSVGGEPDVAVDPSGVGAESGTPAGPDAAAEPAPGGVSPEETATGEGDFGGAAAGDELDALLGELRTRYREAEATEEAYRKAAERLRAQQEHVESVSERLAAIRTELAEAQRLVGLLARQQYQDGGLELPAALRLLLGEDPAQEPHDQAVADRAVAAHVATLEALREDERKADRLAREERAALDAEQSLTRDLRTQRDDARRRMDETAALLAGVAEPERAEPTTPGGG